MMVFAGKNIKTIETSKNNSFPPMRSLRLTISVYEWAKMSSNAHYRWLDHPQESAGRQDLVNESRLSLSKNYKKYNLVLKENFLDLATLEEVCSMGEWSAPEFIWNGTQYFRNYSKYTTFFTKNMIELMRSHFWRSLSLIPWKKNSSADGLRCEASFTHPQIFGLLTNLGARTWLEDASVFSKKQNSIHGAAHHYKSVRTCHHERKNRRKLAVLHDFWGFRTLKLQLTCRQLLLFSKKTYFSINKLKFELFKVKFKDMSRLNANAEAFHPAGHLPTSSTTTTLSLLGSAQHGGMAE